MIIKKFFLNSYNHLIKQKNNYLIIRCPYCGDSNNKDHAHLYINTDLHVFHCARCNEGGSLLRLLYKIKNRFTIDVNNIAQYISLNEPKTNNVILDNRNLLVQKEPELIKNWLLQQNLIIDDISILPINTYNAIKQYVKEDDLENGIVYITLGSKLIYRPFIKSKKLRFRTLHLKTNIESNNRLSIFSTYKQSNKLIKYNIAKQKIKAIIGESLTDLIAFYMTKNLEAIYVATNGKYTDNIKSIIDSIDELHFLVDSDATTQEIRFIIKHIAPNKKVFIYLPEDNIDFRSATKIKEVELV